MIMVTKVIMMAMAILMIMMAMVTVMTIFDPDDHGHQGDRCTMTS
jgi:hypothetical protein